MLELPATGKNIVFCNQKPVIFNTMTLPVCCILYNSPLITLHNTFFSVICSVKRKQLKEDTQLTISSVNDVSPVEFI
jgi:hypothetical protein